MIEEIIDELTEFLKLERSMLSGSSSETDMDTRLGNDMNLINEAKKNDKNVTKK
jgi:hypothetical protein